MCRQRSSLSYINCQAFFGTKKEAPHRHFLGALLLMNIDQIQFIYKYNAFERKCKNNFSIQKSALNVSKHFLE